MPVMDRMSEPPNGPGWIDAVTPYNFRVRYASGTTFDFAYTAWKSFIFPRAGA